VWIIQPTATRWAGAFFLSSGEKPSKVGRIHSWEVAELGDNPRLSLAEWTESAWVTASLGVAAPSRQQQRSADQNTSTWELPHFALAPQSMQPVPARHPTGNEIHFLGGFGKSTALISSCRKHPRHMRHSPQWGQGLWSHSGDLHAPNPTSVSRRWKLWSANACWEKMIAPLLKVIELKPWNLASPRFRLSGRWKGGSGHLTNTGESKDTKPTDRDSGLFTGPCQPECWKSYWTLRQERALLLCLLSGETELNWRIDIYNTLWYSWALGTRNCLWVPFSLDILRKRWRSSRFQGL
jgi:hypothetical protein